MVPLQPGDSVGVLIKRRRAALRSVVGCVFVRCDRRELEEKRRRSGGTFVETGSPAKASVIIVQAATLKAQIQQVRANSGRGGEGVELILVENRIAGLERVYLAAISVELVRLLGLHGKSQARVLRQDVVDEESIQIEIDWSTVAAGYSKAVFKPSPR